MAAHALSSRVVEKVAQDLLSGVKVTEVCRRHTVSLPTVAKIRSGAHKSLSDETRNLIKQNKIAKPALAPPKKTQKKLPASKRTELVPDVTLSTLRQNLQTVVACMNVCIEQIDQSYRNSACA